MKYDFTSIIDRHNMDAIAVDGLGIGEMSPAKPKEGFDIIPMWVSEEKKFGLETFICLNYIL